MSNTRRHTHPTWRPGNPEFDEWNEDRRRRHQTGIGSRPVESVKDQQKDRSGWGKQGGKFMCFCKNVKNSLWNLRRKNEHLTELEETEREETD